MGWGTPRRPKTSNKLGIPNRREGSDGDIQVRQTNLGAKLFGKIGGRWNSTFLSSEDEIIGTGGTKIGMDSSGALTVDQIKLTGKIELTSSGTQNICIGTGNNDLGEDNIAIGVSSGTSLASTSEQNICIGTEAGKVITSNNANTIIGAFAAPLCTGGGNIAIGAASGRVLTSGSFNTYIGLNAISSGTTVSNEVVLAGGGAAGGGVIGKGSGTVLLGTSATTDVYMSSDSGASVHCNTIFLSEVASAKTYIGGHGQLWVKATSPNVLMFTDDAGTDFTVDVSSV